MNKTKQAVEIESVEEGSVFETKIDEQWRSQDGKGAENW